MEYHHNNEYRLPLGRTTNNDLYARVRGNTLYVYAGQEPLGYAIQEKEPGGSVQRTIDEFIEREVVTNAVV